MTNIELEQSEREYQNQLVSLFQEKDGLNYNYLGKWQYAEHQSTNQYGRTNSPIYEPDLKDFLKSVMENGMPKYTEYQIDDAIRNLKNKIELNSGNSQKLREKNNEVYKILISGLLAKKTEAGESSRVYLFDFDNPQNNIFSIAEEVSYIDRLKNKNRRPDIVVYVNGIALAVIELKKSVVDIKEGIAQHNSNQKDSIPSFFTTTQFCVVSNKDDFKYATILTPQEFWCPWKKDTNDTTNTYTPEEAYKHFFSKQTFLFLFRWGVLSDGGKKKVMRPHQYHALNAAIPRLKEKSSGVIWHSQGSGKSLTMVWLASYIREKFSDAKIVVITDRTELELQLSKDFQEAGHEIHSATSQLDLLTSLNDPSVWLISSLIHKFGLHPKRGESEEFRIPLDQYIDKLKDIIKKQYPQGFSISSDNVFIFIDECHRTEGGRLHEGMREIMGKNVMLIGFTGTPLLMVDKTDGKKTKKNFKLLEKSSEYKIGKFIHKYLHKQAVADHVILSLQYTARDVSKYIKEDEKDLLQKKYNQKVEGLTEEQKKIIQKRWATLEKVYTSSEPIQRIANSILDDMEFNVLLKQDWCNAMLIAGSIESAYRYYDYFQHKSSNTILRNRCAVVTSYEPSQSGIRNENDGDEIDNEHEIKYRMALQSFEEASTPDCEIKNASDYESWAKKKFINQPYNMKLLIVVDKLITGFDAPCATVLYIDKEMRDHTLFQAVCRVNRLGVDLEDENGNPILSRKEFGLIVDFKNLFDKYKSAIETFNLVGGHFSGFDKTDIEGLLNDFVVNGKKKLENSLEAFEALKGTWGEMNHDQIVEMLKGNNSQEGLAERKAIYKILSNLSASYENISDYMGEAGFTSAESEEFMIKAKEAAELHNRIMLATGDYFDPKCKDKDMRILLDQFLRADNAKDIIEIDDPIDLSFLDLIEANGDTDEIVDEIISKTTDQKAMAEIIEGKARAVINTGKDEGNSEQLTLSFTEQLNEILLRLKEDTNSFKENITAIVNLINKIKYGGSDIPKNIRKIKYTRVLWLNRSEWGGSEDDAVAEKQIMAIKKIIDEDTPPSFTDTETPDYSILIINLKNEFPYLTDEQIQQIFRLIANNY